MALYSMIQFLTVTMLYYIGSDFNAWQFLYIDMFIVIPLSITMSRTGPYHTLDKSRPVGHLISFTVLFSVIFQIVIQAIFQIIIYITLYNQRWFKPLVPYDNKNFLCLENTVLFMYSTTQYLIVVIVLSVGKPFRKSMWSNYWLIFTIVVSGGLTYLMIFTHNPAITKLMGLLDIPSKFRFFIAGLSVVNLLVSYGVEKLHLYMMRKISE